MITLNLTKDEAAVVRHILARIGGNPDATRGIADRVKYKLDNQAKKWSNSTVNLTVDETDNAIFFKP